MGRKGRGVRPICNFMYYIGLYLGPLTYSDWSILWPSKRSFNIWGKWAMATLNLFGDQLEEGMRYFC